MPDLTSPLTEAKEDSLVEFFNRDPLSLTDEDVDKIVAILWAKQEQWEVVEKVKKANPTSRAKKKEATPADLEALKKELGL